MLRTISLCAAMTACACAAAHAEILRASALLTEPVADPNGLILEATVSDVSRADAPSIFLAGVTFQTVGQPRYDLAITYDPSVLQPQAIYALRVTLSRDGRLVATTDTHYPVLADGMASEEAVEVLLQPVR